VPAIAIETWKGPSLTRGLEDGSWRARRLWNVIGAATQTAALNAVEALGVVRGSQHPDSPRLICDAMECADGLKLRQVTATYSIPTLGQFDPDPLNAKTRWRWQPSTLVEPSDRDFYGNPFYASVGIPFDEPGQWLQGLMDLTATRNEPYYDAAKALAIQNRTNSDVFTVQGGGVVKKGQAYIVNMGVETDIYDGVPYARITYNFRFKQGRLIDNSDEYDSFWDVRLDQADSGWMADGQAKKRGLFCNSDGWAVGSVPLNGNGLPLDATIKVVSVAANGTPTIGAPVVTPIPLAPETRTVSRIVNSALLALYLCQRRVGQYAVLSLGL
jgi:hypothetical protein